MSEVEVSQATPRTRRAILAGALAGIGAAVARAVTGPMPVRAAGDDGQVLHIGDTWGDAQSQTTLGNQANSNRVLWVASNADLGHGDGVAITGFSAKSVGVEGWSPTGRGVFGHASSGYGVYGDTDGGGYAVFGHATTGRAVAGFSDGNYGVMGRSDSTIGHAGVFGLGAGGTSPGVEGQGNIGAPGVLGYSGGYIPTKRPKTGVQGYQGSDPAGAGVFGEAPLGVGVRGASASGYAFRGSGRVRFDKVSGVATIAAGQTSKTISPGVNVSAGSFVLLSPKANIGSRALWYTTNTSANSFTIHLGSSRSSDTPVGWLLMR